ncbi:MAG: type II toxin-antitoxin system Phd/YefM family antitoxin [Rhodospirillales bacterium]|nr:type II toxin-antitoxin system Phd/YefM family antitoxin [Rhodospirillales bacterium]
MAVTVNVHEAKTHFSKLLERVRQGEDVVIAKAGKPVARLVPIDQRRPDRKPGSARGKFIVHDSFDDPLPEDIQKYFEGRGD